MGNTAATEQETATEQKIAYDNLRAFIVNATEWLIRTKNIETMETIEITPKQLEHLNSLIHDISEQITEAKKEIAKFEVKHPEIINLNQKIK